MGGYVQGKREFFYLHSVCAQQLPNCFRVLKSLLALDFHFSGLWPSDSSHDFSLINLLTLATHMSQNTGLLQWIRGKDGGLKEQF